MGKIKETEDCYTNQAPTNDRESGLSRPSYIGLLQLIKNFQFDEDQLEPTQLRFNGLADGAVSNRNLLSADSVSEVLDDAM